MLTAKAQARADADQASRIACQTRERIGHTLNVVKDLLRPLERCLTVAGDGHASRRAHEQLHAECAFQQRDAFADMRWRDPHLRRCRDEARPSRNRAEKVEVAEEAIISG